MLMIIENYYLSEMYKTYIETNSPLIHSNMRFFKKQELICTYGCTLTGWIDIKDNVIFSDAKNDFGHCTPYLYERKLIGDTRFNENISVGEDMLFNMEIILKNGGVYNTDINGYNYIRDNSKLSYTNPNKGDILKQFSKIESIYGENHI